MYVAWNENELNNPTEQGLDAGSLQGSTVIQTEDPEVKRPSKDLVVEIHRHTDGKLLRVMKTIANAGRLEIHVDC